MALDHSREVMTIAALAEHRTATEFLKKFSKYLVCCTVCFWKGAAAELLCQQDAECDYPGEYQGHLYCPRCSSNQVERADGMVHKMAKEDMIDQRLWPDDGEPYN